MEMYRFNDNLYRFMDSKLLTIGQASKMIGVSIQTLRRWDESGRLNSVRKKKAGHRYYRRSDIEDYTRSNLKDPLKLAKNWVFDNFKKEPHSDFYCKNISIFQARSTRMKDDIIRMHSNRYG